MTMSSTASIGTFTPTSRAELPAAEDRSDPRSYAFAMAKQLGAGINLGNALDAPTEGAWGVTLNDQDFINVARAGFNHVRIPVRWSAHASTDTPYTIDEAFAKRVDWAIDSAFRVGLRVVINVHHYEELTVDPKAHTPRFIGLWRQIASRYASRPESLYFELLNEPNGELDDDATNSLFARVLPSVRETNPRRIVILGPTQWNNIRRLDALVLPEQDPNLVVTVHYYEPHFFTHQGAPWDAKAKLVSGMVWPGPLGGPQEIQADFDRVVAFGKSRHRPLYLGEFGVYGATPMQYRKAWTKAVVDIARAAELPYAYWELRSGFGAFDSTRNAWRKELIDAILPDHQLDAAVRAQGD